MRDRRCAVAVVVANQYLQRAALGHASIPLRFIRVTAQEQQVTASLFEYRGIRKVTLVVVQPRFVHLHQVGRLVHLVWQQYFQVGAAADREIALHAVIRVARLRQGDQVRRTRQLRQAYRLGGRRRFGCGGKSGEEQERDQDEAAFHVSDYSAEGWLARRVRWPRRSRVGAQNANFVRLVFLESASGHRSLRINANAPALPPSARDLPARIPRWRKPPRAATTAPRWNPC